MNAQHHLNPRQPCAAPQPVLVELRCPLSRQMYRAWRCQRCGFQLVPVGTAYQHSHDYLYAQEIVTVRK